MILKKDLQKRIEYLEKFVDDLNQTIHIIDFSQKHPPKFKLLQSIKWNGESGTIIDSYVTYGYCSSYRTYTLLINDERKYAEEKALISDNEGQQS